MAKITFMDRDNTLRDFEINEDVVTIGREANNNLVIADPSVSRNHATVEKKEDGYYLHDKNSSNGTYVNGKKISQQKLKHKDKINFGSASIVFEDEEQEGATFIIPRADLPEPQRAEMMNTEERPTDAISSRDVAAADEKPLPPPPPLVSSKPAAAAPQPSPPSPPPPAAPPPPSRPQAQAPAPPAPPKPEAEPPGVLCPNCRKVLEAGARFCGFCGTPLGGPRSAGPVGASVAPPPPAPPSPSAAPPPPRPAAPPVAKPAPPEAPRHEPIAPPPPKPMPMAPPPVMKAEPMQQVANLNYAGFGPRLVAALIDGVIMTLLMAIPLVGAFVLAGGLTMLTGGAEETSAFAGLIILACYGLAFLIVFGYEIYFLGAKGATPGKRIMKLRVTSPDGTYPIGFGKAVLRVLVRVFVSGLCFIGYIMIFFDKEQCRALHDRLAGTVVLKEA